MSDAATKLLMASLEAQAYQRMLQLQCCLRAHDGRRKNDVIVDLTPVSYGDVTCEATTVMPNKGGARYIWRYHGKFIRKRDEVMAILATEIERMADHERA